MLAVVCTIATRDYTGLIVFAVSFVAFWFFLWQKIRSSGRRG